jgi:transposase
MKENITISVDLGDRHQLVVVVDGDGVEVECVKIANTQKAVRGYFQAYKGARVALEAGTHSGWVSRVLEEMGLRVYVGNPRKLRLIWDSIDKSDERDARMLALVCRVEPKLESGARSGPLVPL